MKVVTVGTSKVCECLIDAFKKTDIEVFACVGRDSVRTKEFASKNGINYHANDFEQVIRSNVFDTIYLAIPNSLHYEYAKMALENGKNVICEKPLASNLKEAKELVSLASKNKLFLFDAITTLHGLAYKQLKDDIKSIGKIKTVDVTYCCLSSKYERFLEGEEITNLSYKYCGGSLMDLGVYNISFITGLFGLPKAVKYYPNMQKNVDTSGIAILKYDDMLVTSVCGKDATGENGFIIRGEKGYIVCHNVNSDFSEYEICLNDGIKKMRSYKTNGKYVDELNDFKSIFEYRNYQKANEYLTNSLMCLKVLDELRKSCGIVFAND